MYFLDGRFLVFLPAIACLYWLVPDRSRRWVLLLADVAWLSLFSPSTILALSGLTLVIVYPFSRAAAAARRDRHDGGDRAKRLGYAGIAALIACATLLRLHAYFLPDAKLSALPLGTELLQWIGFSYFLLKGIHVMLQTSRGIISVPRPIILLQYVLFLPTLTSGPIYRLEDFTKQLAAPKPLGWDDVHDGILRVAIGLGKKVVAVPLLLGVLGPLKAHGLVGKPPAFVVMYVMLFLDFSGYSDIAIGTGRLLGFTVPENFKNPFTATTLTQFWRNWHATLGDWLRENVFIPMGGMRAKGWHLSAIVVFSMFVIGLWHGFHVAFIAWGLYHGVMLLVENRLDVKPLRRHNTPRWRLAVRYALVQAVVIAGMFAFLRNAVP